MKIIILFLLFSICAMQEVGPSWSDEAKATFYQTERISPESALYLQLGCPLPFCNLGYAYSDNWARGFKRDIWIIGLVATGAAFNSEERVCAYANNYGYCLQYEYEKQNEELTAAITLAIAGIIIYKNIDVYKTAERYNDNLFNRVFGEFRPYFSANYSKSNGAVLSMNIPIN